MTWAGPKSNDKDPKRHTGEKTDLGEGDVETEAEVGVTGPQAKEAKEGQEPPKAGRGKEEILP